MEAEAAAFEAANFYWFVKGLVDQERRVTVVGNERYGDLFVVGPLKRYFQDLNIRVSSYKVGSSQNFETVQDIFPESFIEYLISEGSDLIIVDGTKNNFVENNPRLPNSMNGYLDWLLVFNYCAGDLSQFEKRLSSVESKKDFERIAKKIKLKNPELAFDISFWHTSEEPKILVGGKEETFKKPEFGEKPQAILANPVIKPDSFLGYPDSFKDHNPGFFDDPENQAGRKLYVFSNHGIIKTDGGIPVEVVIENAQGYISSAVSKWIRRLDPAFR